LSAHGVAPEVRENCRERGLRVIDAVCPLVSKVHAEARRYADSDHLVALVGHADHVEVIGTRGERPDATVVIESPEDARRLDTGGKPVAVVTQTTLTLDDDRTTGGARLERPRGGDGGTRGRPFPAPARGRGEMTSVEIPVSIAAALPNLVVLDITNDVKHEVADTGGNGIAFVAPNGRPSL